MCDRHKKNSTMTTAVVLCLQAPGGEL